MNLDQLARQAVVDLLDAGHDPAGGGLEDLHARRRRRARLRVTGAAGLVALVAGAATLTLAPRDREADPAGTHAELINGQMIGASVDTDQPFMALTGELEFAGSAALLGALPEGAWLLGFDADGSELQYVEAGEVASVDLVSGEHRTLWQCPDDGPLCTTLAAVSPEGRELAITRSTDDDSWLELVDLRTGESEVLHRGRSVGAPAWSPDGGTLAYPAAEGVLLFDRTGGETRELLGPQRTPGYLADVAWSPGGDRLAYVQPVDARGPYPSFELLVVDVGTGDAQAVADLGNCACLSSSAPQVAWSPDGRFLAATTTRYFVSVDAPGTGTVLVMRPDGSRVQTLGTNRDYYALLWQPVIVQR